MINIEREKYALPLPEKKSEEEDVYVYQVTLYQRIFYKACFLSSCWFSSVLLFPWQNLTYHPQEPEELINNVKELLALQVDHQGRTYQPDVSLNNQKSAHDQLLPNKKSVERDCNNLNMEDEDYDHLNYTRTVNELSPNYIKLNNEK